MGVKIAPVGVGDTVSQEELECMGTDGRYKLVDKFEELAQAMYDVLDLVCTWCVSERKVLIR